MLSNGEIDITVYNHLVNREAKTPNLYFLPKIHKGIVPPPGRPIMSANGCPTEKISQFVDHFLKKPSTLHRSYVKDTTHFLQILDSVGALPPNSTLVAFDVTSLYTNIPNKDGILAAKLALQKTRTEIGIKPSNDSLVQLMEFVLSKNNFKFNGENFLQIGGCTMGSKMSPHFADLYMAYFEETFVYTHRLKPFLWVRFLDDIFCIFTHGDEELNKFLTHLNQCDANIKFTMEASKKSVSFLDTQVSIKEDSIQTDLYCKPTDAHNYLLFSSSHPRSCKTSIPYSQFLRIKRICSNLEDFDKHAKFIGQHFLRRGYPLHIIEESVIKVRRLNRHTLLYPVSDTKKQDKPTVLVTTYNPHDNCLVNIAKKNWDILGKSTNTTFLHESRLLTAYRRPANLRDMLVKADCKIRQPKGSNSNPSSSIPPTDTQIVASSSTGELTTSGSVPRNSSIGNLINTRLQPNACKNKKCRYCPKLDKCGEIISTQSSEKFTTKFNISCRSSNIIYGITCLTCQKQYVGQTKRKLAARFQGHFYSIKNAIEATNKGERRPAKDAVGLHFSRPDHNGVQDLKICVLDFIHLPPQSERALKLRLKIEKAWIHRLRCTAPHGLNIFD